MIIKSAEELNSIINKIAIAAGSDKRNANRLAEALVSANLRGVDTHGIWQLPGYIDLIKTGEIIPTNWPEIISETSNTALIKGNFTFGQVTAKFAMEIAIKKARKNNIAVVSGVQVSHTGRLGEYSELAVSKKIISFIYSGGFSEEDPIAVPYGGAKRVLSTNPFSMGFPAGEEPPIISDFATTSVSGTKIHFAKEKKQDLPPDCIVDKIGRPSCNPQDFFDGGGLVPFGEHKGYALMLANEFLGRIFANTETYARKDRLGSTCRYSGFTIIALKPNIFCTYQEYVDHMDEIIRRIRKVPPAPGFREVLIPGDKSRRTYTERIKEGIPIDDNIWDSVVKSANFLGVNDL